MELKIKGSGCHLFNFMVAELMKHAFKLAFERGLTDLKGLVEPDSFCETDAQGIGCYDLELELLRTLEDTAIQYLLRSVDTLIETARVYRIINGFDMLETILDDEMFIIATGRAGAQGSVI